MLRGSVSGDGVEISHLEPKLMAFEPLSVSTSDGVKLVFSDGWLLIRASGTEPRIRITAEARSLGRVRELYDCALEVIGSCAGEER